MNPSECWTKSWNPITGCSKISPACDHCYAEKMSKRLQGRFGYPKDNPFALTFHPDKLEAPLHWRTPQRVFLGSMTDWMHTDVQTQWIDQIVEVMEACPQHTFLTLTKRPQNLKPKLYGVTADNPIRELGGGDYLPNLWLGVTAENQEAANERIPALLKIPAAGHFVSIEPMLGPIDLQGEVLARTCGGKYPFPKLPLEHRTRDIELLDWVICGGENGHGARPMQPDWARDLRDQCIAAHVPFWFKGTGRWTICTSCNGHGKIWNYADKAAPHAKCLACKASGFQSTGGYTTLDSQNNHQLPSSVVGGPSASTVVHSSLSTVHCPEALNV